MQIGKKTFDTRHRTYIMGILNVTPDSFSDGGCFQDSDTALRHGEQMVKDGADILDVGGESTRPGHVQITPEEEISRIVPVIRRLKEHLDVPISVDTYKSTVAQAALEAGADLINDIWGLKYDGNLAKIIADAGVSCTLMHNREDTGYKDYMQDVLNDLSESIRLARQAGIPDHKILIDPGVGFGKTYENNLEIIRRLEVLHSFGYPVILGASRKSVIGNALDLPVEQRLEGTLATTVFGTIKGVMFVRVHDVKENARIIKMTEAILHG